MTNKAPVMIEYTKHYKTISFNVQYSYRQNELEKLFFAAQPLESYNELGHSHDFLYGQIDSEMHLQIGIRDFLFTMNQDFHKRLGILYEHIRDEFVRFNNLNL